MELENTIKENSVSIKATNDKYIGKFFKLQIVINSVIIAEKKIEICNLF